MEQDCLRKDAFVPNVEHRAEEFNEQKELLNKQNRAVRLEHGEVFKLIQRLLHRRVGECIIIELVVSIV